MAMREDESNCMDDDIIHWRKWSAGTILATLGEVQSENLIDFRVAKVTCWIMTVIANEASESILCTQAMQNCGNYLFSSSF